MKIFYSFFFIRDRIPTKQILKTLLFSLVLVGFSKTPVKACVMGYQDSILLDEIEFLETIPKQLEEATFKGDIELTRVTSFEAKQDFSNTIIARAIVHESETHPQFVGKKMMLFYHTENFCHHTVSLAGDRGLAMGRALKLGSEVLYVVPYVLSFDGGFHLLTEDESIPLREFYPDGYW